MKLTRKHTFIKFGSFEYPFVLCPMQGKESPAPIWKYPTQDSTDGAAHIRPITVPFQLSNLKKEKRV